MSKAEPRASALEEYEAAVAARIAEGREHVRGWIAARTPTEHEDGLEVAAFVEGETARARKVVAREVADCLERADELEGQAQQLAESIGQLDVDPRTREQAQRKFDRAVAEAECLTPSINQAIRDAQPERDVARLKAMLAEKREVAERREDALEVLRNRAAEAEVLRGDRDALLAEAADLRSHADRMAADIEVFIAEREAVWARRFYDARARKRELDRRVEPKPALDSANEIWDPVVVYTGDRKRVEIPVYVPNA